MRVTLAFFRCFGVLLMREKLRVLRHGILSMLLFWVAACTPNTAPSAAQAAVAQQEVPGSSSPQAWIDAPLNGATLAMGAVEIVSHAASPNGIAQVELSVNGVVVRTDTNPNVNETLSLARQTWLPFAGGTYQVSVRAQNTQGAWSAPASITITILEQPTSTPPPTALPTREPTWTPTPAGPLTIVLVRNSFCRTGPGQVYREITALATGDSAEIRGVSQDGFWLFVYWPKFRVECWIVASAAPPGTDWSGVPVLAAPPTPAPTSPPQPTAVPLTPTPYKP
ncbi:MAG: hypothetical protein DDG60_03845 [Anaerolineae bacterium]|nr:MAG: hypothetical protein DDG60_03845 [Anaerolineae bacterium]